MIKKFSDLIKEEYKEKIFAHTSVARDPETLSDHSEKTLSYCKLLFDKLGLQVVFERILAQVTTPTAIPLFLELIECIICHHDLGKINPVFQKEKMNNNLSINALTLKSTHSMYGKILFDWLFFDDFFLARNGLIQNPKDKKISDCLFFLLSQAIDRHHSSLRDIDDLALKIKDDGQIKSEVNSLNEISEKLFVNWSPVTAKELVNYYTFKGGNVYNINCFSPEQQEALFYLYKMTYSLLILSDYYATMEYMEGIPYHDKIRIINQQLRDNIFINFYEIEFNKKLKDEKYCSYLLDRDGGRIEELNELRTKILLEADCKLRRIITENPNQRVFYLNVPTGGGKTNISLKLSTTLLDLKKEIKRIFYVFPFINIIEQNYDVIKKTLGLNEEISAVYSSSSWRIDSEGQGERLRYVLDNEFLNHPVVVMSNVNFFNTFVKADKTSNYRLINLVNSVVILDEIQSLNDKDWTLFNDLIEFGSRYLNIYFIIMSATLPRLNTLLDFEDKNVSTDLIVNSEKYSVHKTFRERVDVRYREDIVDLDGIINLLKAQLEDNNIKKILLVVNTIKDSLDLYNLLTNNGSLNNKYNNDYSVYLLNSTILPHRRKSIIKDMKNENGKIILVSTQSVEAGVDIDCDLGIRDFAIFDSIEQIAGRINRNFKRSTSKLIIVNLLQDERKKANIYRDSYRWQTIEKQYGGNQGITKFLESRNFNTFYNAVLRGIRDRDNDTIRESSINRVRKGIRGLDFDDLNKTEIIKQDSVSLIVNVEIPVSDLELSEQELVFLQDQNINSLNDISGRTIWERYKEFMANFKRGYIDRKINTKIWSSLLSKFTVSIERYKLDAFIRPKGGITFLCSGYDIERGLDISKLTENNFVSFEDSII